MNNHRPLTTHLLTTHLLDALILISTPAGRLSLLSASIVLAVACTMSISRLCVRISNCWRAFLSMVGPDSTVYRSIRVGSGIGPCTSLCVRLAVSTISAALWSRIAWSYASIRIRITSFAAATLYLLLGVCGWRSQPQPLGLNCGIRCLQLVNQATASPALSEPISFTHNCRLDKHPSRRNSPRISTEGLPFQPKAQSAVSPKCYWTRQTSSTPAQWRSVRER